MKVLFLPKWYPDSRDLQFGVFIQKHAKAVSQYCKVAVLYVATHDNLEAINPIHYSEANGFPELIVYYKANNSGNPLLKLRQLIRYWKATLKGFQLIRKKFGDPDIFHVNIMARPGILPLWLNKTKGTPYVITEQWSGYSYGDFQKKSWADRFFCRLIGNQAEGIIVVSTALEKKMKTCGFKNRFFIVPNVVEKVELQHVEKKEDEKVRILNISDMDDSKKNISGIINAFAIVASTNYLIELHIIGGGKDEKAMRDLASSKTGIKDRIFFYGKQNNHFVYQTMPKMDFLVTNSYFETFSVATVEALVNGKPVIVSKCGGPEDFITPEVGILYEAGNVQALVEAMQKMAINYKNYDPAFLSDYANERFNYSAVGQCIAKVYQTILNKN